MTWQKCPVCGGGGTEPFAYVSAGVQPCSVCLGQKIIHDQTGKPPSIQTIKLEPMTEGEMLRQLEQARGTK